MDKAKEVGACGNICSGCPDFRVLQKNDPAFRRLVAAKLTEELGRDVAPDEIGCEGCWGNIHTHLAASLECPIRQCVDRKGFATCGECDLFPCGTYLAQFSEDSSYARNISTIRETGLDMWLAMQKARREEE
ncbi:MAG: DUF3795 domain-containing protein [Candidatus Sumerlaeota bacterium]